LANSPTSTLYRRLIRKNTKLSYFEDLSKNTEHFRKVCSDMANSPTLGISSEKISDKNISLDLDIKIFISIL